MKAELNETDRRPTTTTTLSNCGSNSGRGEIREREREKGDDDAVLIAPQNQPIVSIRALVLLPGNCRVPSEFN